MTTDEMDAKTDYFAKSDSNSFPAAEKLSYYADADGILNGLILSEQEDRAELEYVRDTVAGQVAYLAPSRIHNVKWLKVDFGTGFVPARYRSEASLIDRYGTELETMLASWPASDPIYFFKGKHLFVYPAATADTEGDDRLTASLELLPSDLDRSTNNTPPLVPDNFHYLHAAYAALSWLDEDDPLWAKNQRRWTEGVALMLKTMYPRALQDELVSGTPADDGSDY
jgi:hypothetical protein